MPTVVRMTTSAGEILIALYTEEMPITAGNFLNLVDSGYYDGTHFHRVIKDFMIQAGCPNSRDPNSPQCGFGNPGYSIKDEHPEGVRHSNDVGTISMANTGGPNSGGSQFFINTNHNSSLDWWDPRTPSKHPVFGEVVEGMENVYRIENCDIKPGDRPYEPQQIINIKRI